MKKISLFLTFLLAMMYYGQSTDLVKYQFEGNLNPDPGAVGSPSITRVNASDFTFVAGGNPGQSLTTSVNKNKTTYIRLQVSTAGFTNLFLSFDGYGDKTKWQVYANTSGTVPAFNTASADYLGEYGNTLTWTAFTLSMSKFNNSPTVTVFLVPTVIIGNNELARMDNLRIFECKTPPAPTAPSVQTFCAGATVSALQATVSNPSNAIQWFNTASSTTPLSADTALITGTYYAAQISNCGSISAKTPVSVTVNSILQAGVSISANPGTTVCAGTSVTFTANPVNGGTAPTYQWQINGVNVAGATSPVFTTSSLVNNNQVRVIMTSNASPCLTGSPATSNTITMTVNPPVSAGSVSYTSNSICIGGTSTYSTNGTPGGTWSSSNTAVATVNAAGVVTGIAPGTANIIYTLNSGCGAPVSVSAVITVNPDVNAGVISYNSNQVCMGGAVTYTSNGTPGGTWSSSNTAVAIVGNNGIVYGVSPGTAVITYTINSGCGAPKSVSENVTVTVLPVATVSVGGSPTICNNSSAIFTVTAPPGAMVLYTLNGGPLSVLIISDSGTSQVVVPNATTNQTFNLVSVTNGACANPTPSSTTITIGGTSTYAGGTWSNGLPNNNGMSAVIAEDYDTAAGNISACNCTVNSGATLTVSADTFVEVLNEVTNNGKLIVKSDGNLKQVNAVLNTTPIEVRRLHTLTAARKEYNFLSSPVAGQNMKTIFGNNAANVPFVTVLKESTNSYVNAVAADYEVKAKGFSVREPRVAYVDLSGDNLPVNEAQYKGISNNGPIELPLSWTLYRGYNLAGNPYPSNMDIMELYANSTKDVIDPTFRFWDNSVNDIYVQQGGAYQGYSYALFNAETDTDGFGVAAPGNNNGGPAGTKVPNRIIKVSQAFMIRTTGAGAQLNFNNSMRKTTNTDTVFFGKTSPKDRYRLQLVKSDGFTVQNGVSYFAAGNQDFGREDSRIPNASASDALFTYAGDAKVVINGRSTFSTEDVVTVGLRHFTAGTYTIQSVDEEGVFANGQPIYLKDKQLGIVTDLTAGDYSFAAEAGEFTNRFEIVYQRDVKLATSGNAAVSSTVEVFRDASDFVVRSGDQNIEEVELYDAAGRLVLSVQGNSKELRFEAESLLNGMYVVKAKLKSGVLQTKKIRK